MDLYCGIYFNVTGIINMDIVRQISIFYWQALSFNKTLKTNDICPSERCPHINSLVLQNSRYACREPATLIAAVVQMSN